MNFHYSTTNFKCDSSGVYRLEEDSKGNAKWNWMGRAIYLSKSFRDIETKELMWEVTFQCADGFQTDVISRKDVTEQRFTVLMAKGADVTTWRTKVIIDYLLELEETLAIQNRHHQLGWVTKSNEVYYAHEGLLAMESINSTYYGEFNISPKGNAEKWKRAMIENVIGHPSLELALCMGFSSVLVGYLNRVLDIHVDSLIFHISGNSTTGKTTAAMVAVSGFGDPKERPYSLIQSFNGTDNALTKLISNNNGCPLVCDETSLATMKTNKLVNVLYTWAKNIEKSRLTHKSQLRERSTWATSIITTGEGSLVNQANNNEGIRARVFEFQNIQWTKDAAHATAINHSLTMNYGHAVKSFIENLLFYDKSYIWKAWLAETERMKILLPPSKFNDRISKKFALLMMTANLLHETFSFNLDLDGIQALLIEQEQQSLEERRIGQKAYEVIRNWLIKNQKHFHINDYLVKESETVWGKIITNKRNTSMEVYILPEEFKQMLKQYKFYDHLVVLRELKEMGVLITEKDKAQIKYFARKVIEGDFKKENRVTVYAVSFQGIFINDPASIQDVKNKKHRS